MFSLHLQIGQNQLPTLGAEMKFRYRMLKWFLAIWSFSSLISATFLIATPPRVEVSKLPPSVTRPVSFANDIQPILEGSCLRCHGPLAAMSQFRLDNRDSLLKGGVRGADVIPGQSAASPLIHFVANQVPELQMPPIGQGNTLTPEQIALLGAWIDQGAEWPAGLVLRSRAQQDALSPASSLPPPAARRIDYVKDIQPILAEKCYSCHGQGQQNNGLRWDVKAIATKGGISGPAFLPGRSTESLVIRLVAGLDKNRVMPLKGARLTPDEIGLLRAWIDQGAHWPDDLDSQDAAARSVTHWAYTSLVRPAMPKLRDSSWARTPIDFFILAKLQEKGLQPSPPADRRTLLRRVTYDLTGLPPTPDEVKAFLLDQSPDAYSRVVDRLLASPRYGERWARHWLDVVHYADSHGHDQDVPRDNAWPYRDSRPYDLDPSLHRLRLSLLKTRSSLEQRHSKIDAVAATLENPRIKRVSARIEELDQELNSREKLGALALSKTLGYQSEVASSLEEQKWVQVDLGESIPISQIFLVPVQLPTSPNSGFGFQLVSESTSPTIVTSAITKRLPITLEKTFPIPVRSLLQSVALSSQAVIFESQPFHLPRKSRTPGSLHWPNCSPFREKIM
jgi:mono/diheme cytochrome c family protein